MNKVSRIYLVVGLVISTALSVNAQRVFGTKWKSTLGSISNGVVHSVTTTRDGGFMVSGTLPTDSSGMEIFIAKTDSAGKKVWSKQHGGKKDESGVKIIQTADGGYIAVGSTTTTNTENSDLLIMKFNQFGNKEWLKTAGGSFDDYGTSIKELPDSGFIVCGNTMTEGENQDYVLSRYTVTGTLVWQKVIGTAQFEQANDIVIKGDVVFLVGTVFESGREKQIYIAKFDLSGTMLWKKTYGGPFDDMANSVIETVDGNLALLGTTYSYGRGDADIILAKLDTNGILQWYQTYGGECFDMGISVKQFSYGDFLISAVSRSFAPKFQDATVILADSRGKTKFCAPFSGLFTEDGSPMTIVKDSTFVLSHYTTGYPQTYVFLTQIGMVSASLPASKGLEWESFTCRKSLDSIGYFGDEGHPTFWSIDQSEEAMISTSSGPNEKSSIYTDPFIGSVNDSVLVATCKVLVPTDGGPKWENKIKFWLSVTNGSDKLYTLLFKPIYDKKKSKRWDLKIIKDFNAIYEDDDEKQVVLGKASVNLKNTNILTKSKVGLQFAIRHDGYLTVYIQMTESDPWVPVITAYDNAYKSFTNLHFQYKTGKREYNYPILVDDLYVRLIPKEIVQQ